MGEKNNLRWFGPKRREGKVLRGEESELQDRMIG